MSPIGSEVHDGAPEAWPNERKQARVRAPWWWMAVLALLCAGALILLWLRPWTEPVQPLPRDTVAPHPAPASPAAAPPAPVAATVPPFAREPVTLPALAESDDFVRLLLEPLVGGTAVARLVAPRELVRRFVVTVDNLPRSGALWPLFPLRVPAGRFMVTESGQDLLPDAMNAARYDVYARTFALMPTSAALAAYARVYPLLQAQYRELGYPDAQFHARVLAAIDSLLDTPDASTPPTLQRGRVMYRFADPDLEALPAGQKLLLRIGPANARLVKEKLTELRAGLVALTHTGQPAR